MNLKSLEKLRRWFTSSSRDFPWRENPTPYKVWVSEIMLQQTQAAVVIPYFLRWMKKFPDIKSLAKASEEEVLKEWEGLGYYSRARNLHQGAKFLLNASEGNLPCCPIQLRKIKGIGSYTAGAILSFAFHQKKAAVDGNVLRVLSRFYAIDEDISKQKTVQKIEGMADTLLPEKEPWVITEALIELGATVCTKVPKCKECPLKQDCKAFQNDLTEKLPIRSDRVATTKLFRTVVVIKCEEFVLVQKGEKGKIMADLYQFPFFEEKALLLDGSEVERAIRNRWAIETQWEKFLPEETHSFTRYKAYLAPHVLKTKYPVELSGYEWVALEELPKKTFSSGHKKISLQLLS